MYSDVATPDKMILTHIFTQYPFHVDRLDCSIIGHSNGNMLLTEQELRSALKCGCKAWLVDDKGEETPITLEEFAAIQDDIFIPEEDEDTGDGEEDGDESDPSEENPPVETDQGDTEPSVPTPGSDNTEDIEPKSTEDEV